MQDGFAGSIGATHIDISLPIHNETGTSSADSDSEEEQDRHHRPRRRRRDRRRSLRTRDRHAGTSAEEQNPAGTRTAGTGFSQKRPDSPGEGRERSRSRGRDTRERSREPESREPSRRPTRGHVVEKEEKISRTIKHRFWPSVYCDNMPYLNLKIDTNVGHIRRDVRSFLTWSDNAPQCDHHFLTKPVSIKEMTKFHKIPWRLPVPEDEKEEYLET